MAFFSGGIRPARHQAPRMSRTLRPPPLFRGAERPTGLILRAWWVRSAPTRLPAAGRAAQRSKGAGAGAAHCGGHERRRAAPKALGTAAVRRRCSSRRRRAAPKALATAAVRRRYSCERRRAAPKALATAAVRRRYSSRRRRAAPKALATTAVRRRNSGRRRRAAPKALARSRQAKVLR